MKRKMKRKLPSKEMKVISETGITIIEESFLPEEPKKKKKKKMKRKFPTSEELNSTLAPISIKNSISVKEFNKKTKKKHIHDRIIMRKDGKPNCFVCYEPLDLLRKLTEMKENDQDYTDAYNTLRLRVNNTIVRIPSNRKYGLFRHEKCEPGSPKHNKNKILKKHAAKTLSE
jgi:hypothetical protein